MYTNDFESWEKSLGNIPETSLLPSSQIETIVENSTDPIQCAMDVNNHIQNMTPEAQDSFIRLANSEINYRYTHDHLNRPVHVRISEMFDISGANETSDMMEMLIILKRDTEVMAGGRMSFFERHYFIDPTTGEKLPRISLRLHSPGFLDPEKKSNDGVVQLPNYLTVPVSAISQYEIFEHDQR